MDSRYIVMALSLLGCNMLFLYNRYNFDASAGLMLADYDTIPQISC